MANTVGNWTDEKSPDYDADPVDGVDHTDEQLAMFRTVVKANSS